MDGRFRDRRDAGRALAASLGRFAHRPDVRVLGLPRGGVPVAYEVARALGAPLDVLLVRKLGVPGHEELAMGAIATGGAQVIDGEIVRACGVGRSELEAIVRRVREEGSRREALFRPRRGPPDVRGKTVLVVDDGLATGSTMRAAVQALRQLGAGSVVAAAPVSSEEACALLRAEADEVACGMTPPTFLSVGGFYEDFGQTSDDEVLAYLELARRTLPEEAAEVIP